MRVPRARASPGFFWQGLLILLPALVLAAAGLYAIRQDRLLVEHDATEQARRLANDLGRLTLPRALTVSLPAKELTDRLRTRDYRPADDPLVAWAANGNSVAFLADSAFALIWPPPLQDWPVPQPVALDALDDPQGLAWADFTRSVWLPEVALAEVIAARDNVLATQPPDSLAALTHYQTAVRCLRLGELRQARESLELVRTRYANAVGETGLSLKVLAERQLLRHFASVAGREPMDRAWLNDCLAGLQQPPTALSDWLFAELEQQLEQKDFSSPSMRQEWLRSIADWKRRRLIHENARRLWETLRKPETLRSNSAAFASTRFWIQWDGQPWWVTRQLGHGGMWLVALPASNVVARVQAALPQTPAPPHLAVAVAVGGVAVVCGPTNASVLAAYPSGNGGVDRTFEVTVSLANPTALYARQRVRSFWLGFLVIAAVGSVFAGFLAARRAFHRQRQLSELKTNFVSSVSHELRAPIASVRLMAEELDDLGRPDSAKSQQYHRFMAQECRRLSGLIENVLDFARLEQGRKTWTFEPTDLTGLVAATVQTLQPYAAEKQVSLQARLSQDPIEIEADGQALQQVLVNLLDNAVKFSPPGAEVVVDLETVGNGAPDGSLARLAVSDHGPGVPPEDQRRIFERFYRRGSELRRETTGIGIGLSIVKHIVEAHRGDVRVDSDIGKGSRFIVTLPLQAPREERGNPGGPR